MSLAADVLMHAEQAKDALPLLIEVADARPDTLGRGEDDVQVGARLDQAKSHRQAMGEDQGRPRTHRRLEFVSPEIAVSLIRNHDRDNVRLSGRLRRRQDAKTVGGRRRPRRRRASGGPAEKTFATLIGLELRPRALREASALWAQLREQRGIEGRDGVWRHPDLIPTADDLADPTSWLEATGDLEG